MLGLTRGLLGGVGDRYNSPINCTYQIARHGCSISQYSNCTLTYIQTSLNVAAQNAGFIEHRHRLLIGSSRLSAHLEEWKGRIVEEPACLS